MIVDATDTALPHMFLRGFRAPVGQKVAHLQGDPLDPEDDAVTFQEVGTFVARAVVDFSGDIDTESEVATEDVVYDNMPAAGPFRYEADIPVWKPDLDVVIVDAIGNISAVVTDPTFPPPPAGEYSDAEAAVIDGLMVAASFGTVAIRRGTGPLDPFDAAIARNFGWLPRGSGGRLALAGDAATNDPWQLNKFDAERFELPSGYDNAFQNGNPLPGEAGFSAGQALRFTDTTPVGGVRTLTIPPGPVLTVTEDGAPLDPPLDLAPLVDTVVMDRGAQQFLLIWRATFPWEARFESATLEVS
jgi:hypothetical protein